MKSLIFCLLMVVSPTINELPDLTGITTALRSGDAESLASFFDEEVELALLDEEDVYDKDDAKNLVAEFFKSHTAKSFSQVHKGTSKGEDSHYVIGDLSAGTETYRIYIYLKEIDGQYKIQELRIEE